MQRKQPRRLTFNDAIPLLWSQFVEENLTEDAGIVDQDVDIAEFLFGALHHRANRSFVADVRMHLQRATPRLFDCFQHRRGYLFAEDIGDHHVRSFRGKSSGDRPSDAPGAPGDDRHAILQLVHLLRPFPCAANI